PREEEADRREGDDRERRPGSAADARRDRARRDPRGDQPGDEDAREPLARDETRRREDASVERLRPVLLARRRSPPRPPPPPPPRRPRPGRPGADTTAGVDRRHRSQGKVYADREGETRGATEDARDRESPARQDEAPRQMSREHALDDGLHESGLRRGDLLRPE